MNLIIEPRHWILMSMAVLAAAAASLALPLVVPLMPLTRIAVLLLGAAVIFDVLGDCAARYRGPMKSVAWLFVASAAYLALWSLTGLWTTIEGTYTSWRSAGWSLPRSGWEALKVLERFTPVQQIAIWISLAIGVLGLALAIATPLSAAFNPRIRRDRHSKTGPWQAGWMAPTEITQLARNTTGLPLALHKGGLLRYAKTGDWRGGHHLVVSGTRGGKGVSTVIPAILDHHGPVVALDIKGENFAVTRRHRRSLGRQVAVLNPFGLIEDPSDQFNPLDFLRDDDLERGIDVLADGLVKPEDGSGAHFAQMARQLVAAAIEVVVTQEKPERRNLVTVADLLLAPDFDQTLEAWATNADLVGHRPAQVAATILRAGDRERGSIQTSIAKAFAWMQSDAMRTFLTRSTFDMEDLLDDKLDLFIAVPLDQVDKQAVFMRLFINIVLGLALRLDGRRKVTAPILLVLDEFVRMGRMDQILNIANVAAGVGFEALFVTQDIGQVQKSYGKNDADSIFGSCITKRLFNLNDIGTAEWAVRHLGDSTIYAQQIKEGRTSTDRRDLSYAEQRQKLMTPEQILEMPPDGVLVLIGGKKPLKAKQNKYYENKRYKKWTDENPLN